MRYRVVKPFRNIDGAFLKVNDSIECTQERARSLLRYGMIGNRMEYAVAIDKIAPEVNKTENAMEKPVKRKYRRRKK